MPETFTKMELPPANPHNVEATKFYIFNETGNIMMVSTDALGTEIPQSVRDIFSEVSVFFAAMTRAIATTENPDTNKPYSIYNYAALRKIIAGSGLFIHVTQSDISHVTSSVGVTLSKELLEGLLGLATGAGALSFAQGMLASIGKEGLRIGISRNDQKAEVANIIFVCEYLLGMPTISAMVVYANVMENKEVFELGPCINVTTGGQTFKMHKDTYLFVTPKFVRDYSDDLGSIASNAAFNDFVEYLRAILTNHPRVESVLNAADQPVTGDMKLIPGKTYKVMGVNLSTVTDVKFRDNAILSFISSSYSEVKFSVNADAITTQVKPVDLINADDEVAASTDAFGIGQRPPEDDLSDPDPGPDDGADGSGRSPLTGLPPNSPSVPRRRT